MQVMHVHKTSIEGLVSLTEGLGLKRTHRSSADLFITVWVKIRSGDSQKSSKLLQWAFFPPGGLAHPWGHPPNSLTVPCRSYHYESYFNYSWDSALEKWSRRIGNRRNFTPELGKAMGKAIKSVQLKFVLLQNKIICGGQQNIAMWCVTARDENWRSLRQRISHRWLCTLVNCIFSC